MSTLQKICAVLIFVVIMVFVAVSFDSGDDQLARAPVTIGATLPVTGNLAAYGESLRDGILLAEAEVNENGGINGRLLSVEIADNAGEPAQATTNVQRFVASEYPVVFNSFENMTMATRSVVQDAQTTMFSLSLTYVFSADDNPQFTFRDYWDFGNIGQQFAQAANNIGANQVAIIGQNDSSYEQFKESFSDLFSGEIALEETFQYGARDFRTQVTRIGNADVDTVVVYGLPVEASVLLGQMRDAGLTDINLLTTEGSEAVVRGQAQDYLAAVNAITYRGATATDGDFVGRFEDAYSYDPRPDARYAYEDVKLVADALRSCEEESNISGTCVRDYLENSGEFDDNHNRFRELPLVRYADNGEPESSSTSTEAN